MPPERLAPLAQLGSSNVILRATARQHFVRDYPGPLSIKTVISGEVAWRLSDRSLVVNEASFLVLNDREPYSMNIDSPRSVSTFCIFFARGFVENVFASMRRTDPDLVDPPAIQFVSRLHCGSPGFLRSPAPASPCDEYFLRIANDLLMLYDETHAAVRRVPSMRPGTRAEVFRRLCRAREFLHANAGARVTLSEIARAACLSPFHLQRHFTAAFGESPRQYLTRLRLERARSLLSSPERSVTEVCHETGFESLGSFSNLFRRTFGYSPTAARGHS